MYTTESEEEGHELRRVKDEIPWTLWTVAFIGFWERATFWGCKWLELSPNTDQTLTVCLIVTAPWQNYMQHPPRLDQDQIPGALNLGQTTATRAFCGFFILYFTIPIFIAPLADNVLGQYNTIVIGMAVYVLGCIALVISSLPSMLDRGAGIPGLVVAMVLIAIGGGSAQAVMRSFIANQYTNRINRKAKLSGSKSRALKWLRRTWLSKYLPASSRGEVVMIDSERTLKFIYNLYFWVGNVGSLLSFPVVYIEKKYGFFPAYALGLGCICIAFVMVIRGRKYFVNPSRTGDVMIPAAKVITCAARHGCRMDCADPEYQLEKHGKTVPWTSQFVNEIARALGACRVFLAFIVFYICFDQMQNNLISQASTMKTGSTPNDVLPGMNQVGCILFSPLVEYVLDPILARRRIYLRPVTRIVIGFSFVVLAMLYAAVLQHFIYISPPCFDHPSSCGDHQSTAQARPDVWYQAPVYFLVAVGEVFAMTTAMEYAETHAPKQMKVLVQAINMLVTGIGSAIALVIAEGARDPYLVHFYGSLAGAMAVTTIIFYIVFRNYDREIVASSLEETANVDNGPVSTTTSRHSEDPGRASPGSPVSVIMVVLRDEKHTESTGKLVPPS
ncbi:peptide transporter PTR2-A [Pyrenophora tritici-repentis]|uniref:Peptide transporter PTR2-A n=1 Tax=Pyrenophora tritici-repentis (strain Pt-1C-BFP) TaxID=426418 RepID=B2WI06_PYRTR|nr:peptide transporter PTR2-A [Pyrenophora tritici-repentis Pt-1C-BFP]EDU42666.1 peptide transporter PTR2-A [Pyrenophora tritici-repentis Pt-1C-BFP]KAI0612619.1 peptide transporter PTR2-A [Pyrenophora tritici-repentis]